MDRAVAYGVENWPLEFGFEMIVRNVHEFWVRKLVENHKII